MLVFLKMTVDDPFSNIRHFQNSSLQSQKTVVSLLASVEETLTELNRQLSPEEYFSALLPLFNIDSNNTPDFQSSLSYLFSCVIPLVPKNLLREHYSAIYSAIVDGFQAFKHYTSYTRSTYTIIPHILLSVASDKEKTSVNDLFVILLTGVADHRPKVRKLAQKSVCEILTNETLDAQRFAKLTSDFLKPIILRATKKDFALLLHTLPFLNMLKPVKDIANIVFSTVEHCLGLNSPYVSEAILSFLSNTPLSSSEYSKAMFSAMKKHSEHKSPDWYHVFLKLGIQLQIVSDQDFASSLMPGLGAPDTEWDYLLASLKREDIDNALLVSVLLESTKYVHNLKNNLKHLADSSNHLLSFLAHLFSSIEKPCVELGEILSLFDKMYQHKFSQPLRSKIGVLFGAAIKNFGLEYVLSCLGTDDFTWMLPTIRDYNHSSNISLFLNVLLPLAKKYKQHLADKPAESGEQNNSKIHTAYTQIWSCLPSFLSYPKDLHASFDEIFKIMVHCAYNEPELRPFILNSIQVLYEKHDVSERAFLAEKSLQFLPLLFNLYPNIPKVRRAALDNCISAVISLTPTDHFETLHGKLFNRLLSLSDFKDKQALADVIELESAIVAGSDSHSQLFYSSDFFCLLKADDPQLLKISLKLIDTIVEKACQNLVAQEHDRSKTWLLELLNTLTSTNSAFPSVCNKTRIRIFNRISEHLDEIIQYIPLILPEIILGIKDCNSKSRKESFDLLVAWAEKMNVAGHGISVTDPSGRVASIEEYILMISAGLAGKTPHMISATIVALGRVLFSFHSNISTSFTHTIITDIVALLGSASREIVKAAIGFIKIAVVCIPKDTLESHVKKIVQGLLHWSTIHHQNFKVKIRHIIQRIIKKYGFETVYSATPSDHYPLLNNLHKRSERASRRRANSNNPAGSEQNVINASGSNNFDEFFNAPSESDVGGSDASESDGFDVAYHEAEQDIDEGLRKALKRKLSILKMPTKNPKLNRNNYSDDDYEMEETNEGKLNIKLKGLSEDELD